MHEPARFFVGDKTDGGVCSDFLFGINGDGMEVSSPLKVVQNSS